MIYNLNINIVAKNPIINTNIRIIILFKLNNSLPSFVSLIEEFTLEVVLFRLSFVFLTSLSELTDLSPLAELEDWEEEPPEEPAELEEEPPEEPAELEEDPLPELELWATELLWELSEDEDTSSTYSLPWPGCAKAIPKQDKTNKTETNIAKNL